MRRIRKLADQSLDRLNPTFCKLYAAEGSPSVPPEQLLLASLLQAFYGISSERLLLDLQEEWQHKRRRFFSEATMAKIPEPDEPLELTDADEADQLTAAIG